MIDELAGPKRPGKRPLPVTLLAGLYLFLGIVFAGMGIQDLAWDEFKPGKPMDPDLLPWAIGLLSLAFAFAGTAAGLFRMRRWGRRSALGLGALFVFTGIYGLTESAPLLALLITPGAALLIGFLYLLRPGVASRFGT
ncbi:MAG: hypothetical protein Q8R92_13145 [Deltaproteobacteria bacterium]|nr:hypothetical protein [Deltaproteobacteria bacterium]